MVNKVVRLAIVVDTVEEGVEGSIIKAFFYIIYIDPVSTVIG